MNLLDMSCHVSFLIELPAALGNWTCEWFFVSVCPLMREKFIHTFEDTLVKNGSLYVVSRIRFFWFMKDKVVRIREV